MWTGWSRFDGTFPPEKVGVLWLRRHPDDFRWLGAGMSGADPTAEHRNRWPFCREEGESHGTGKIGNSQAVVKA